jgi:hypothetical protein
MQIQSPFTMVKGLENQTVAVLSALDVYTMPQAERKIVTELRRNLTDARLDVRDYELSETRDEQLEKAKIAKERLDQVRKLILAASEANIFSAIDVAQLTATIEHISTNLI